MLKSLLPGLLVLTLGLTATAEAAQKRDKRMWKAGIARAVITPEKTQWLSGYGSKRPAEGKRHDLWIKALALEDARGRRSVAITTDLVGVSKGMYDRVMARCRKQYGLNSDQVMLTYSHNHCAPVTSDCLPDYYPLEPADWKAVDEYSLVLETQIVDLVGAALSRMVSATLSAGEGMTPFAVNRRNNKEAEVPELLAKGTPLTGPNDHSVPVLAVHDPQGKLLAAMFGYACHPTTLSDLQWCGDYPGYAQIEVEKAHPGAVALFWTGCGGDQNPLPRRTVALCEKYGSMLATAVNDTLKQPLRPLDPELRTGFEMVRLDFDRRPTRAELEADSKSPNSVRARWATRMLKLMEAGSTFAEKCDYGVQAWRMGDQLWIALGGEAVVDYSLRFKREYGPRTWVAGYAHDMVGYVPSRRVWNEGGYEAEYIYEYGWLAYKWTADTEDRIAAAVSRLVKKVSPK